jgi:diguanylate cyclase (GGDEF)-like protein
MNTVKNYDKLLRSNYLMLSVASVSVLILTFVISNVNLTFGVKLLIFSAVTIVYLLFITINYRRQNTGQFSAGDESNFFNAETEEKLLILEEAGEFFGASLKSGDMFRLLSGRIGELVPFANCSLFLTDETKSNLKIAYSTGKNAKNLKNSEINMAEGLAGKTYVSGKSQTDERLLRDHAVFPPEALENLHGTITVPIFQNSEIFAVLQLFGDAEKSFDKNSVLLLEAVASRIVPLLSGSLAFEKSLSNALTDALTNLPNERAFYLVLENQIAEAQRLSEKRQLTVLVMDIRNFKDVNDQYGHSTGDQILAFAAATIKNQLRQMDFLARSSSDEFFAVLPTASQDITEDIIKRIERAFILNPYKIAHEENIHLQIGFGAATFLQDGETAEELLRLALVKKKQSKSDGNNQVLFFPKEFIN